MNDVQSLSHSTWECKYHVGWIPPKYVVAQVIGYMKGKSSIHIARTYLGQKKNYVGMYFGARGYYVSTVGTDEEV